MCVVPGRRVAGEGIVEGLARGAVQPAGVDLSAGEILVLEGPGALGEGKLLPPARPVLSRGGWWSLSPGAYKVRFREVVRVPLGSVGLCYPRSSLLRMGVQVACAVWDPGYQGRGEALLVVHNPYGWRLRVGERIAQIVFHRLCESPGEGYRGSYQGENLS